MCVLIDSNSLCHLFGIIRLLILWHHLRLIKIKPSDKNKNCIIRKKKGSVDIVRIISTMCVFFMG